MGDKELTLQDIEALQQQLDEDNQEDELAYLMALMGKPEMIERTVRREIVKRWLIIEARLMRNNKSNIVH